MILYNSDTNDPYINLATEEYLFRKSSDEIVYLYINSPSVIVGKHQNAYDELNLQFVTENSIPVIRRISGGGTVFHDGGNLNFTFISNRPDGRQVSFEEQTRPVVDFLVSQGLNPIRGEKNELRADGLKFSGNAEHLFKNRLLHHGTLLFSSKLDSLGASLKRGEGRYTGRAVGSNRTVVGNLADKLPVFKDINDFRQALSDYLREQNPGINDWSPSGNDAKAINELVKERYSKEEWNFGYSPDYTFDNSFISNGKLTVIRLEVRRGIISSAKVEGDQEWAATASILVGVPHLLSEISTVLKAKGIQLTFQDLFRFFN